MVARQSDPANPGPKDPIAYLAEVFSSRVRAMVLSYLVVREDNAYSLTEIARGLELSISSVQHECYKLERLQILFARRLDGSRRYRLDRAFPPTLALIQLVRGAFPVAELLRRSLEDLITIANLEAAAIARADSARITNLVLIGDLTLDQVASLQDRISDILGISPDQLHIAFFKSEQWREHRRSGHELVERLLALRPIPLIGQLDLDS